MRFSLVFLGSLDWEVLSCYGGEQNDGVEQTRLSVACTYLASFIGDMVISDYPIRNIRSIRLWLVVNCVDAMGKVHFDGTLR